MARLRFLGRLLLRCILQDAEHRLPARFTPWPLFPEAPRPSRRQGPATFAMARRCRRLLIPEPKRVGAPVVGVLNRDPSIAVLGVDGGAGG